MSKHPKMTLKGNNMLSVTFQTAIIIDAANLHSLLSLANTPALVESYAAPEAPAPVVAAKRVRKAAASDDGAQKAKRTRRTKAQMAEAAAAAGGEAPKEPEVPKSESTSVVVNEEKVSSPALTEALTKAAPLGSPPKATAPAKKRDRRSAAQKAKDAEKDAKPSGKDKSTTKASSSSAPDPAVLLDRFAKLIDTEFEKAKAVLDEFGVNRFSELKADQHGAFDAKLTELGV